MRISCAHVEGHYELEDEPQWHAPQTEVLVDGEVKVRITGDESELSVSWIENGRAIDDLVGCTPAFLRHGAVVEHWLARLGAPAPADALQACGIKDNAEHRDQAEEASQLIAA
jgi:hypothetical protein